MEPDFNDLSHTVNGSQFDHSLWLPKSGRPIDPCLVKIVRTDKLQPTVVPVSKEASDI